MYRGFIPDFAEFFRRIGGIRMLLPVLMKLKYIPVRGLNYLDIFGRLRNGIYLLLQIILW